MGRLKLFLAFAALALGMVAAPLTASGPPRVPAVEHVRLHGEPDAARRSRRRPNPAAGRLQLRPGLLGRHRVPGDYDGWRAIDITNPSRPKEIVFQPCNGNQGDVVVWDDILVRSYNTPAPAGRRSVRRRADPGRLRGHPRLRHLEPGESGARRVGPAPRRLAHGHGRPGSREQPPDPLQPDVRLDAAVHLDHRGPARQSGGDRQDRGGAARGRRRLSRQRRDPGQRQQAGLREPRPRQRLRHRRQRARPAGA